MASFMFPLPIFLLLFLHQPPFSMANIHKSKNLLRENILSQLSNTTPSNGNSPTVYFEVTKPIKLPNTKPCSYLVLQHDFGFTYGRPPVIVNYTPPHCDSENFAKIVLEWKATCKGTQFDRIFGVWLGGIELLRSCTAEPTSNGIVWSVEKDLTRYSSLLIKKEKQNLALFLGNIVDKSYTGVYHVNLTFHFYPAETNANNEKQSLNNSASNFDSKADLILPISRDLPLNDGLWFEVQNSNDTKLKKFKIPQNVYRAVLEVYISFHEKDEFWYGNFPNDYIVANNLSDPENGPFREVVVSLDGEVIGAVWPFTVIYTGGINPQFWSPITGISSFNLPSYDIEITPFLGNMLDGKSHTLGFSVTNSLNVWFIDANLHLWLDSRSVKTEGKLVKFNKVVSVNEESDFKGLNGKFLTSAKRFISSTGWIKSSYGNITTHSIQEFGYNNSQKIGNNGNLQVVNQIIHFNDRVYMKMPYLYVHTEESFKAFALNLYLDLSEQGEEAFLYVTNVSLGFNEKKYKTVGFDFFISSLQNMQDAQAVLAVKDYFIIERLQRTRQVYDYHGSDFCYSRNISSSNSIIDYDEVSKLCGNGAMPVSDFELKSVRLHLAHLLAHVNISNSSISSINVIPF